MKYQYFTPLPCTVSEDEQGRGVVKIEGRLPMRFASLPAAIAWVQDRGQIGHEPGPDGDRYTRGTVTLVEWYEYDDDRNLVGKGQRYGKAEVAHAQ